MKLQRWIASAVFVFAVAAHAEDTLKLAIGQRGNWDTSIAEVGQRAGIFKKHGLVLEILWTQGSGETQQPVVSGNVDIGVAVGVMGALALYSKGAPVRIIGAHLLPNAAQAIIVSITLAVARGILLESALSFFGVGVRPPQASWGNMLYQAQTTLATEPWLAFAPGLFILVTTLSVNLAGDRLASRSSPNPDS